MINLSNIHPLKRALASLSANSKLHLTHTSQLSKLHKNPSLLDNNHPDQYSNILSYTYNLFSFIHPSSLHYFHPYTDQQIGGSSTCNIYHDQQRQYITIEGIVNAENKDKLEQHPSIGIYRNRNYKIRGGPFNAIQVQIQHDGEPVHVGVELQSNIQGVVGCYGIIVSKLKGWNNYELPLENMLVVGAQDGPRGSQNYRMPPNSSTFFNRQAYDARRLLNTQCTQPIIHDINIRLLNTETTPRKLNLRNINLVRRAYSVQFMRQYQQPYFFIVKKDPYLVNSQLNISWLEQGYNQFNVIDLGDKVYRRVGNGNKKKDGGGGGRGTQL